MSAIYCSRECNRRRWEKDNPEKYKQYRRKYARSEKRKKVSHRYRFNPKNRERLLKRQREWNTSEQGTKFRRDWTRKERGWTEEMVKSYPEPLLHYGTRVKSKDGDIADSVSEAIIDDWLYEHAIPHKRHVPLCEERNWTCDFVVEDVWIEFDGFGDKRPSTSDLQEKIRYYEKNDLDFIILTEKDLTKLSKKLGFLLQYSLYQSTLKDL